MTTQPIPTAADWTADPKGALAASLALAQQTSSDATSSSVTAALGILAQIGEAALPLVGAAIPGGAGAITTATLSLILSELATMHSATAAALTAPQQALLTTTIQVATAAVTAKLAPPKAP